MPTAVHATLVRRLAALIAVASPLSAIAQGTSSSVAPPPYIAATAVGESRVTPDRALVQVSVQSQGATAAAAAADIRETQERIIAAVKGLGIAAAQIRTVGYQVSPEYAQPERGKGMRVTGYRASNTVQVEVRAIDNVGKVIDASLAAGATDIGSVALFSSNTDAARREAVQHAVTKARAEAEAAATAAGGTLGTLIELTIDPGAVPRPMLQQVVVTGAAASMRNESMMSTPVEPGESLVMAVVRVRWQFVAATR